MNKPNNSFIQPKNISSREKYTQIPRIHNKSFNGIQDKNQFLNLLNKDKLFKLKVGNSKTNRDLRPKN